MRIGVPKEVKDQEFRVGLVPSSVRELILQGHTVIVEHDAGLGAGILDADYEAAGATIVKDPQQVFETTDMIVKVKEPQPTECRMLRSNQILLTYLHLAPDPQQAKLLCASNCIAIAYETVTDEKGGVPLLAPMSEVAGRMSIHVGAHCLEKSQGGRGILLGGVPGVAPAKVVIIGGGAAGTQAARMAIGMEAEVTLIEKSLTRLQELDREFSARLNTIYSTRGVIEEYVLDADLVIGAVLIPGATAPKLVTRDIVKKMRKGSVIVDIAIDQGGCFETSRPTTHTQPTYVEEGVVHYCVTNMPGAVARTATFALNNATLPFVMAIANQGYQRALQADPHLQKGLNVFRGHITHQAVAEALDMPYVSADEVLA